MIKYKQWIKETLQNNIVNYNNTEYLHVHKWLIKDLSQRNLMMVIREFPESEGGGGLQDLPNYQVVVYYHLLTNDIRLAMVRTITSFLYQMVFM